MGGGEGGRDAGKGEGGGRAGDRGEGRAMLKKSMCVRVRESDTPTECEPKGNKEEWREGAGWNGCWRERGGERPPSCA